MYKAPRTRKFFQFKVVCKLCFSVIKQGTCSCGNVEVIPLHKKELPANNLCVFVDDPATIGFRFDKIKLHTKYHVLEVIGRSSVVGLELFEYQFYLDKKEN